MNATRTRSGLPASVDSGRQMAGPVAPAPGAWSFLPGRIRSILVPMDLSPSSRQALREAVVLARQHGAKLTLLNVVESNAAPGFVPLPPGDGFDRVMMRSKRKLERVAAREGLDPGLVENLEIRQGVPYREINAAARILHVDLIVIATHGRGGPAPEFVGSTARAVVRHAGCPVLVVRGQDRTAFTTGSDFVQTTDIPMIAKYHVEYALELGGHREPHVRDYQTDDPVTCEAFLLAALEHGIRIQAIRHEGVDLSQKEFDALVGNAARGLAAKHIAKSLGLTAEQVHYRFKLAS